MDSSEEGVIKLLRAEWGAMEASSRAAVSLPGELKSPDMQKQKHEKRK